MASQSTAAASSMAASPTGWDGGVSKPLDSISDNDKGGLIAILSAFALSLVLVAFPIRTYVRYKLGTYKMDDYAFLGAALFAVFQASMVFYELHRGLGRTEDQINPDDIVPMQKAAYASDILYIITIFFSKCATAFLFLRLTPGRGHAYAIWGAISTSIVWVIVSILLVAFRCHASHPWTDTTSECTGLLARWEFIGALDIVTEAALFLISVYLVWGIQMSLKSKTIVICAFGCRLPTAVLTGLRLYFLNIEINSTDIYLLSSNAVACTQLEIGYSIIASIVPCLKPFMTPYERELDGPTQYRDYQYGNGGSHKLSSLASNSGADDQKPGSLEAIPEQGQEGIGRLGAKFMGRLRPEQTAYEARVRAATESERGEVGRKSADSQNSRKMIIKKGVEWSVDYDGRNASPGSKEEDHFRIEEVNSHHDR